MSQELDQLYESLFTFEQMLTESLTQCAEVFELAESARIPSLTARLRDGIIPQLQEFLDGESDYSMSAIVESIEGNSNTPEPRMQESQRELQYSNSGNPKYDDMFNSLLESSVEIEQTGRTKFKLDEIDTPSEDEIEKTAHPLTESSGIGQPPRQPGQKEKVEFDGMENWRSIVNESTPSQPGGGAEDAINSIMNFSEATPATPPQGSPETSNDSADVDPSVANILSNL